MRPAEFRAAPYIRIIAVFSLFYKSIKPPYIILYVY